MKQAPIYQYHPQFIFRSPSLPFQKEKVDRELFFKFTQRVFFKEAIYLASPVLHDELLKCHNGTIKEEKDVEKLITSLYKYYTRTQTRCTPYGLFAACSSGK